MPLAELLRQTATAQLGADASGDAAERLAAAAADLLTQYGVCSAAPAERYSDGMLDAVLQDAEVFQRVCYAAAEITIPAGGTVCVDTNILLKRLIIWCRCCIMKMVMRNEKIHFHA